MFMWLMLLGTFVFLLILYLFINSREGNVTYLDNPGIYIIAGLVIVVNILAIVMTMAKARKKRNSSIGLLEGDYLENYDICDEIVRLSNVQIRDKKAIMTMVLEIFAIAQEENKTIELVTGGNVETFINNFINEYGGKRSVFYNIYYGGMIYIMYLFFMKTYMFLKYNEFNLEGFMIAKLDLGIVVFYAIVAFVFFPLLMYAYKISAIKNYTGIKRGVILLPFIIPFGLVAYMILSHGSEYSQWRDIEVSVFGDAWSIMLGIILIIALPLLMKFEQKRNIRK